MRDEGFSLIELLMVVSVSSVLLLALNSFVVGGFQSWNQDYNKTLVLSNAKTAVSVVARQVEASKGVESTNSLPDNNAPSAPGNLYSWSGTSGNGANLILAVPSKDASGNIIYSDGTHASIYADEVIYYLDSSSHKLYRRYLANPSATGNRAVTTCPPSKANASCPVDADVVDDVANLVTTYLDSSGNATVIQSGTEAVKYTITETRTINGRSIQGTYSTVGDLRNK